MADLFHSNVALWATTHPKQALLLPYTDVSAVEFCKTDLGEPNLVKADKSFYYHSQSGALREAEEWFKECTLQGIQAFFVFGIGLGYAYEAAKNWLAEDRKRHLIFLENELAVIYRLFETERGSAILSDPQVHLYYFKNLDDTTEVFEPLYWKFAVQKLALSALSIYARTQKTLYEDLSHKIAFDAATKNALLDEYLRCGGAFFINFYPNMLCLDRSYYGNGLFGMFPRVPAIICGAGPSLDKHLGLLKQMDNRAIIFAGGSAMNALNSAGIQPHFGIGIDPNQMQFARLTTNEAFETPFFYRNRMFHDAFRMIHGPRLYIGGSGGYTISDWFEDKLGIQAEPIDEGHNVVNFALEIAHLMGCNPIIFLGMDLGYTDMKTYAPGIEENVQVNTTQLLSDDSFDGKAIIRNDIHGKPLYTVWKWVAEAEWIGNYAKDHPNLVMINCTEGGLGFPHVPNEPFEKICHSHLTRTHELRSRIHGEIMNHPLKGVTLRKVKGLFRRLLKSLERCQDHLHVMSDDYEEQIRKIEEIQSSDGVIQGGLSVLAEIELAEEDAYDAILGIFNLVYSQYLNAKLQEIHGDHFLPDWQKQIARIRLSQDKISFLLSVAKVNQELIPFTVKEYDKWRRKKAH